MIRVERIPLDRKNRMLRIGFGLQKGIPFARLDLWFFGLRFKR